MQNRNITNINKFRLEPNAFIYSHAICKFDKTDINSDIDFTKPLIQSHNGRIYYAERELAQARSVLEEDQEHTVRQDKNALVQIFLIGAPTVIGPSDCDITPTGKVRKALLALLCTADNGTRSRAYLQTMLWPDRTSSQASASLRNALSLLRMELQCAGHDFIQADRSSVRIELTRVWIDIHALQGHPQPNLDTISQKRADAAKATTFMEGFDLGLGDDEGFEEWLVQERAYFDAVLQKSVETDLAPEAHVVAIGGDAPQMIVPSQSSCDAYPLQVGLLPSVVFNDDQFHTFFADTILDEIASNLNILADVGCVEMRGKDFFGHDLRSKPSPLLLLRIKFVAAQSDIRIALLAYQASNRKRVWFNSVDVPASEFEAAGIQHHPIVAGFVASNADSIAHMLTKHSAHSLPRLSALPILTRLFNFKNCQVQDLHDELALLAYDKDNPDYIQHSALLAYTKTFYVGEQLGNYNQIVFDEVDALTQRVMEHNSMNALTQSAIGHVLGYVTRQHEMGGQALKRAVTLNPNLAFAWDHLALHHLYTGKLQEARNASDRALLLGRYSPIWHTFETTRAMIATVEGDFLLGAHLGRKVLSRAANSGAALRYTTICEVMLNNSRSASDLLKTLEGITPDFGTEWLEGNLTFAPVEMRKTLTKKLRAYELN